MRILCVIPARYASTRLPGKPLKDIAGRPMICRVYERASKAKTLSGVIVATDDERIKVAVERNGGKAIMTRPDHPTGTDRLAEAAEKYDDIDIIINVQGDEPLIEPTLIDELGEALAGDDALSMATVMTEITDEDEQKNPNNVKVITDKNGCALYFSRSLIPFPRVPGKAKVYKHIGIYAYRRDFLLRFAGLAPTPGEQAESLEQLRALENGFKIKLIETKAKFVGVDTEEDLRKVNEIYKNMQGE